MYAETDEGLQEHYKKHHRDHACKAPEIDSSSNVNQYNVRTASSESVQPIIAHNDTSPVKGGSSPVLQNVGIGKTKDKDEIDNGDLSVHFTPEEISIVDMCMPNFLPRKGCDLADYNEITQGEASIEMCVEMLGNGRTKADLIALRSQAYRESRPVRTLRRPPKLDHDPHREKSERLSMKVNSIKRDEKCDIKPELLPSSSSNKRSAKRTQIDNTTQDIKGSSGANPPNTSFRGKGKGKRRAEESPSVHFECADEVIARALRQPLARRVITEVTKRSLSNNIEWCYEVRFADDLPTDLPLPITRSEVERMEHHMQVLDKYDEEHPKDMDNADRTYEVKAIMKHRYAKRTRRPKVEEWDADDLEFNIEWVGFPYDEHEWISRSDLQCTGMLNQYKLSEETKKKRKFIVSKVNDLETLCDDIICRFMMDE